jgi:integrase/recombinase XerD
MINRDADTKVRGGAAKALGREDLQKVIKVINKRGNAVEASMVKLLLSVHAGLRACEIADLRVIDVMNANGTTSDVIRIRPGATKGGRGREVPVSSQLRRAIDVFRLKYPRSEWLAISQRYRKYKRQSANAVAVWFHQLYKEAGLSGCSSHSGRRTFITTLSRNLGPGHSIRDVQVIVGHRRLDTTQAYIECSPHQHNLVNAMSDLLDDVVGVSFF